MTMTTPEEKAAQLFASCGWRSTGPNGLETRVANLIREAINAAYERAAEVADDYEQDMGHGTPTKIGIAIRGLKNG